VTTQTYCLQPIVVYSRAAEGSRAEGISIAGENERFRTEEEVGIGFHQVHPQHKSVIVRWTRKGFTSKTGEVFLFLHILFDFRVRIP
jgi:hypothetical protein